MDAANAQTWVGRLARHVLGAPRPKANGQAHSSSQLCSAHSFPPPWGRGRGGGWPTLAIALFIGFYLPLLSLAAEPPATQPSRFEVVNIYVDSADRPLAAWQVELKATQGDVKIVGVEGGDHRDLYRDPPYYDPKALSAGTEGGGRIILASYTTSDTAPKGKTLVARLHLRVTGDYRLSITPMAAADPSGQSIPSTASVANAPTTQTPNEKE